MLGEEHPDMLTSMSNLAAFWLDVGDFKRALRLLRRCLSGRRKVLGERHPATISTAEFLRSVEAQLLAGPPSARPRR